MNKQQKQKLSNQLDKQWNELTEQDIIDANFCPECGSLLYHKGGCKECIRCGFSVCD